MSERADLPPDSGRIWQDINSACRGNPPGEVLAHGWLTDAEVLAVLFPDVDWEALRGWVEMFDERDVFEGAGPKVARRLLAVYDGKDG